MKIHHYDSVYNALTKITDARESPAEPGVYLIPANSTTVETTFADDGFARVFNIGTETWSTVEDHRSKTVYRKSDAAEIIVNWLGEIGPDYTELVPEAGQEWNGAGWVNPPATAEQVRGEAYRRITSVYPEWDQINRNRTGNGATEMNAWIDSVRAASNVLEVSLPSDYQNDSHWPSAPA